MEDDRTRGHGKNLFKLRSRLNIRKYSFCHRIVNAWNDLQERVISCDSVEKFKRELDRVWSREEMKFDLKPIK